MKRTICALAAILSLTMPVNAQTYTVVPVDFGDGYSIVDGGFMTITDGELTEWSISVDGEYPFTFQSPESRDSFLFFEGVSVTESEISIQSGILGGLSLTSYYTDGCAANDSCEAIVRWDPEAEIIGFLHRGLHGPGNDPDLSDDGDFLFAINASIPLSGTAVIATVPEPTSASLMAFALLGLGVLRRRR